MDAAYIEVSAEVRYWEDATVNGEDDEDGKLIPLRKGDCWAPVIRLADGQVADWPEGTTADIHYKVCDAGSYWLLNAAHQRIATREGYVPDMLCPTENGFGDHIIMTIGPDGKVQDWTAPEIYPDEWDDAQTYYVKAADGSFAVADPQPKRAAA